MATIITEECINCGACEPECPNTAIYQGGVEFDLAGAKKEALQAEIFYIVPEKCTECVGFFDYEACAAVCPVDCCVTDPQNEESEAVLVARAKELHPDTEFSDPIPSRFSPTSDGGDAAPANGDAPAAAAPAAVAAAGITVAAGPPAPLPEDMEVPIECRTCGGEYAVAYKFLNPGTVLRCPHCGANFTPTRRLFLAIGQRLEDYRAALNGEIDRYNDLIDAEKERLEVTAGNLSDSASRDLRSLVQDATEPRKGTIFG